MAVIRKMMAMMLMGLALTAAQVESGAQSRRNEDRKPVSRPVRPDAKPGGITKPNRPATRPSGPSGHKPGGPVAKPPGHKPGGPAAKPPGHKPGGPVAKPPGYKPGGHKPDYGYRPGPKPGPHPPRPGFGPAPRPPKPPRPVIVVRPSYGSVIAANIASRLLRHAVIASSVPPYDSYNGLRLTHSYVPAGTEYYYQDGVFYIIDSLGLYRTIIPPTGAFVEYLPDDYTTFRRGGNLFYRVDDTVYTLRFIDGLPIFEVLGQLI